MAPAKGSIPTPLAIMDGECALCTVGARLIARFDRTGDIKICPVKSPLGREILTEHGLDPEDADTWLYLDNGRAYTSLDAVIAIGRRVGGPGWLLQVFRPLPQGAKNWLYRRIARNRYALFGRTDMCAVPDPALRERLIDTH